MSDELAQQILAELKAIHRLLDWGMPHTMRTPDGMTWTRSFSGGILVENTTTEHSEAKSVPISKLNPWLVGAAGQD